MASVNRPVFGMEHLSIRKYDISEMNTVIIIS